MSIVTEIIIAATPADHEGRDEPDPGSRSVAPIEGTPIWQLNTWLDSRGYRPLQRIDDYAGGEKVMRSCLWAAAFDHFREETELLVFFRSLNWAVPEWVQLFMRNEENDNGFRVYDTGRREDDGPAALCGLAP